MLNLHFYRLYSNELDTTSDFHALYRQEPNKITDEEMKKMLSDFRKPDKFNKYTVIPGSLEIKVSAINDLPPSKSIISTFLLGYA